MIDEKDIIEKTIDDYWTKKAPELLALMDFEGKKVESEIYYVREEDRIEQEEYDKMMENLRR